MTSCRLPTWFRRVRKCDNNKDACAVVPLFEGTAVQAGRSRVRFPMGSLKIFIDLIHPAALWPWGRLEYKGSALEDKCGRCVGLTTLPPSCADRLEILGAWNCCGSTGLIKSALQVTVALYKKIKQTYLKHSTKRNWDFNLFFGWHYG